MDLIASAPMLDVYLYSEHPKVKGACGFLVDSVLMPRKERKKYWKAVRMLLTNLWVSSSASNNPWRSFSRDRNAYQKGTRYNQIYISYLVVSIVDNLINMGYIEQVNGKFNPETGYGRTSRIRATDKLLDMIRIRDIYSVLKENPDDNSEVVFLRDEEKRLIDYRDNGRTEEVRASLRKINKLLCETRISVSRKALTNEDESVVLTDKKVHCIFNDGDFWTGGRIYGGFWQRIKREFRRTIRINDVPATELDYKANHPSMIYLLSTDQPVPSDCYAIQGYERDVIKAAVMMMINNGNIRSATNALVPFVRRKLKKAISYKQAQSLIKSLEESHEPIVPYLYDKKLGKTLQVIEGEIASDILLTLLKEDVACLPVHDSYIVASHHRERLGVAMIDAYKKHLNKEPKIEIKY